MKQNPIFIRTVGLVVSKQSINVSSMLSAPFHNETESIQMGNVMFCDLFFPACYLDLYCPLLLSLLFYEFWI
jgi:hypothetical protein